MSGLTHSERRALNQLAHARALAYEASIKISLQQELANLKSNGMSGEDALRALQVKVALPSAA